MAANFMRCRKCRERSVRRVSIPYQTEVEHDGRAYAVALDELEVLRCDRCGSIMLGDEANTKITAAFRVQAGLLTPAEIRANRESLGLTQKQLAGFLKISESTVCRWETGVQVQQLAMDALLRLFFEVPACRAHLGCKPNPDMD